jgi:hypothetical protein
MKKTWRVTFLLAAINLLKRDLAIVLSKTLNTPKTNTSNRVKQKREPPISAIFATTFPAL